MQLCVNDKVIEQPTADGIVRALDAASFPADWFITLETDAGAMLDAVAREDGRFAVVHEDNGITRRATPDVDAAALRPMFVKFLNGEPDWDAGCSWSTQRQEPRKMFKFVPAGMVTVRGKSGEAPPPWALATMIGIVAAAGGVSVIAHPWASRHEHGALDEAGLASLAEHGLAGIEVDHQDHDEPKRAALRAIAGDLGLVATGSSDYHGLGKTGHSLACNTTAPEQLERLLELAAAAAARSTRTTPAVVTG
jgi:hypothetical protein